MRLWWSDIRSKVRNRSKQLFRFKTIGGWIIAFCWGIGWTVALSSAASPIPKQLFYVAYLLFLCGFIWSFGAFLISKKLRDLNPKSWSRSKRRKKDVRLGKVLYGTWKSAVSCIIIAVFLFSWWATYSIQNARELQDLHGVLIPANDPDPPNNDCGDLSSYPLRAFFGLQAAATTGDRLGILRVHNSEILGIERGPDNTIAINANIRDGSGKIVTLISRNEFVVNRNGILESLFLRPDRSTIFVTDEYGNKLKIRARNKHALEFTGKLFFAPEQYIEIGPDGLEAGGNKLRQWCFILTSNAPTLVSVD